MYCAFEVGATAKELDRTWRYSEQQISRSITATTTIYLSRYGQTVKELA